MKIRSITCFFHPGKTPPETIKQLSAAIQALEQKFTLAGWEVQTKRLATVPFGIYSNPSNILEKIQTLEKQAMDLGYDYLSIGPARISFPEEYDVLPEILGATENVFATGMLSHEHKGISMEAVRNCAAVITQLAPITPDGFTNLQFCAMSGVPPFTPFFPAAYSYGPQPAFALAIEAADAAVETFSSARTVAAGKADLLRKLEDAAGNLHSIIRGENLQWEMPFKGFDFSLAPFPEDWCSLAHAMELLGAAHIGSMGTLTAAAILAETLDRGTWRRAGFNGLMLPVLEDSVLAQRSIEGTYSIKDLLLYSTVCGTGLDTVPLPGDISAEAIAPLLMDIAALSLRLKKPLTARLMPVPGLNTGDMTAYDFDFFKNGKVLDFPAKHLGNVIANSKWIDIKNRFDL